MRSPDMTEVALRRTQRRIVTQHPGPGIPDACFVGALIDRIEMIPEGFMATATSDHSPFAALRHTSKSFVAVQFHPEVVHTLIGNDVLRNFIFGLCKCSPSWTMSSFIDSTVKAVQEKVGTSKVICALSGGVDSSVVAALVHRAIGDQLKSVVMKNQILFFILYLGTCILYIDSYAQQITRGAQEGELYISTFWYLDIYNYYEHNAIFRSVDNGATITLQYENNTASPPEEMEINWTGTWRCNPWGIIQYWY